jgi:anti-sigma regulatory factor (Ser/Thr protein kinase)
MTGGSVEEAQQNWVSAIADGERRRERRICAIPSDARTMSVGLAAVPEAVKQARDFSRTALSVWGLGGMFDDVRLVVSELVTNAMRHGSSAVPEAGEMPIRLSLLYAGGRLTCAVTDPSDRIPVHRDPDFACQNGRGLQLVEAFSDSWDWVPLADSGKVVWACFRCPE